MQIVSDPPRKFETVVYERPVCPVHGVEMRCGSSPPRSRKRYFYCTIDGCKESQPMPKPRGVSDGSA